jgi:SecD/SecF fusion protein
MPQKYTSRVLMILGVLLVAVMIILPPGSLFRKDLTWSQKVNLKPGIDIAGGTKLLYEIKAPEGGAGGADLSQQVMDALKKRIDPDGVRNLIWRPQGADKLEIQMPLSARSEEAQKARAEFSKAQDALDRTNVRRSDVINAVERLSGEQRRNAFEKLEMGFAKRGELFGALASASDQVKATNAAQDVEKASKAELDYDALKLRIEETNLPSQSLQAILDDRPETRTKRLTELKTQYAGFPTRLAAIDSFVQAYDKFSSVKTQLDDAGELKRLLKGSGVLEFHITVQQPDINSPEAREMVERLKPNGKGISPQPGDEMRWYAVDQPEDMRGMPMQEYAGRMWMLCWTTPEKSMVNKEGQPRWTLAEAHPAQTDFGVRAVGFRFDAEGAVRFGELTANNTKKLMAVMLDNKVISAATIQTVITSSGIISRESGYTNAEFTYLIKTLNAGSLPAQLADEPISEQTVEPQLGSANLKAGLLSTFVGLLVVAVFLIGYYHLAGLIATFAVGMNVLLILASVAAINGTFTLPGIAGIVLTVGAAVDANVLIFERLREEQHRGMGLKMALKNAYQQALSAIVDSNVTTIITSLVLYMLGTEEVKGFGLTLLIGLAWSLFTALFVTRTIFGILIDHFGLKHLGSLPLSHPKWDQALKPNVNWMKLAWIFITVSVVLTVAGLVAFVQKAREGELLDIEFAGGTAVQVELTKDMPQEQVEKLLSTRAKDLPSLGVLRLGSSQRGYEIVTPNTDALRVKAAIMDPNTLGGILKLQVPSTFTFVGQSTEDAIAGGAVVPIDDGAMTVKLPEGTYAPNTVSSHVGGAAFVLQNLQPALKPSEIKDRLTRERLQPQTDPLLSAYRSIDVESPAGNDEATTTAIVLVSDDAINHSRDIEKWRGELVTPMWKLLNDAVAKPPQLQKVSNFGPQVASSTTTSAITALILSVVAIMVYIWFRFGDLKYGTATVVAMIHDTLLVLGFLGLSHYLADNPVGRALMIEPFRINLTIVAAILTVMSYSMIDTIVVFDRIRENRGKYGEVNREEINDSINQTLSRTILTGSTNIFTVLFMYLLGGPAIHGFTFALLIGIIVGTYSSIAIAAPMLLIGNKKAAAADLSRKTTSASAK